MNKQSEGLIEGNDTPRFSILQTNERKQYDEYKN